MNYIKTTLLAACALAMIGCNESTYDSEDSPVVSLASFYSWPEGESERVDFESMGRNNLVFVVDRSGSMDGTACGADVSKSKVTIQALQEFIPQIPNNMAVGYVDFGTDVQERVSLTVGNRQQLVDAANAHDGDMGGTNLTDAVFHAYDMLTQQALRQGSTGTYRIVIITDGAADDATSLARLLDKIDDTPVSIMTAGFCIRGNHSLNQPGDNVYVETSNAEQLVEVMSQAVRDEAAVFSLDFDQ